MLQESHNTTVPIPTVRHFVTEMCCAHSCYEMVHCGIFVSCIVGFVGDGSPETHGSAKYIHMHSKWNSCQLLESDRLQYHT